MGLFDWLPRPKTSFGQLFVVMTGLTGAILALYYIISKIDIIPDGAGPIGYLDDLIMLLLITFTTWKFINHIRGKYSTHKESYKKFLHGITFKSLLKPKLWLIIIIIALAFSYFFWSIDVIPDGISYIGYIDDVIVAIGAFITSLRIYQLKR